MSATHLPLRATVSSIALLLMVAGCTHPASPGASGSAQASTAPATSGVPAPGLVTVRGTASAGPVCPVERASPDPSCADRPVAGAVLVVVDATGAQVARVTSGADGRFQAELAPGSYRLVPEPHEGLMGTPGPVAFQVRAGESVQPLVVSYDTGIR